MAIVTDESEMSAKSRNTAACVAQIAAISVMAIGLLVLLGWLFDVTLFKSVLAGAVSMKPNTALACLFAGASCLMATLNRTNSRLLRWRNAAATAATVLGALTLVEWVFTLDLGIDQLLFRGDPLEVGIVYPGRMAPWTALSFVLLGTALLLLDVHNAMGRSISQSFVLLYCVPAILGLCGYAFGASELYGVGLNAHMAVHTDVALLLLGVGMLSARAERDWIKSAVKDYGIAILAVTAAFLVRWILWPLLGTAIPFLIHWPAIIIAAWYGGFRAGFLATLLSAIGTVYFFLEPLFSLVIARPADQFGTVFFLFLGTGLSFMLEKARQGERTRIVREAEAQAFRAANAYHRSLLEASLDPLVTIGSDGKINDVNAATESATGKARAELIGTDFDDYFTEPDKARAGYKHVFREGSVRDYPLEIRHRDGRLTPVLYNASVYRDEAGNVMGVFAAARDIAERVKAEKARQESETAFRVLADLVPQMVWICQPDGLNIYFNQRWVEYTGLTLKESYGRGWNTPFHPDDKHPAREAWNLAVATGLEYRINCRLRAADGSYRWFLIKGVPLRDAGGAIVKWFGTCTDIDELKREQERLEIFNEELDRRVLERTAQLEASNKELEAFAYSVSHDLRAPLRAIDGFSQILLKECLQNLPERPQHYLQMVCDNTRQMGRLIDDLLHFSRTNRQSLQPQKIATDGVVRQCWEELQPEREGRRVEVQIGDLPACLADGNLLKQVWLNLLGNALKYTRKRDPVRVEIGSQTQDGETVYFVRDNGVGFDMQYADKLFGVFQRLHPVEDYEGTGIGLALVQRILHRHGGRIWAEAQVDQGATFYFTLERKNPNA